MRLIDADALIDALMVYTWRDEDERLIDDADEKREFIKNWMPDLPTVEIPKEQPEIVRCKDCKYATMTIDGDLCKYCELDEDEDGFLREVYRDADWFCADGERR